MDFTSDQPYLTNSTVDDTNMLHSMHALFRSMNRHITVDFFNYYSILPGEYRAEIGHSSNVSLISNTLASKSTHTQVTSSSTSNQTLASARYNLKKKRYNEQNAMKSIIQETLTEILRTLGKDSYVTTIVSQLLSYASEILGLNETVLLIKSEFTRILEEETSENARTFLNGIGDSKLRAATASLLLKQLYNVPDNRKVDDLVDSHSFEQFYFCLKPPSCDVSIS